MPCTGNVNIYTMILIEFSIIFDSVANRKARHQLEKGHYDGNVIVIDLSVALGAATSETPNTNLTWMLMQSKI
ncbi:MAG: hypothetical protein P4L59_22280 [Desulfosporosinus sp.]|nr:hypothetical protein [Desulfosporosinus sp.]